MAENDPQKNNKGRFRQMNIQELQKADSWDIWNELRMTTFGTHSIPLRNITGVYIGGSDLIIGIPENEIYKIGNFWCCKSPQSHIGPFRHAIDFLIKDGAEVLASAEGKIIEIQQESNEYGDGPEYAEKLNYVTIQHFTGEFSQYCHLAQNSVPTHLHVGSRVKKGDVIGIVGKTGWTDRDHLHFIVFEGHNNPFGFRSKKVLF